MKGRNYTASKPVGPDGLKRSEDKAEGSDMIDVKGENPQHVSSAQKSVHCFWLILTYFPFVTQMDEGLRSKTTLQENTI